jgi:hypothetical protein
VPGLRERLPVMVIATAEHRMLVQREFVRRGVNVRSLTPMATCRWLMLMRC